MSARPLVSVVFGTRPEAIKLWKVIDALRGSDAVATHVIFSGQHEHLVLPIAQQLSLDIDEQLSVLRAGQPLGELLGRLITALQESFDRRRPDLVVVQGDTLTALAATLVAFHKQVPVAHVEAGLRSGRLDSPFPEEGGRAAIDVMTHWLFAPTPRAFDNARQVARSEGQVVALTGNTVIEAAREGFLLATSGGAPRAMKRAERTVFVTLHRRENIGDRHRVVLDALKQLVAADPGVRVVLPMHPNPGVRAVVESALTGVRGIELIAPLGYLETLVAIQSADAIVTDSGGIQEEAPALGRRVLVARETTERPEGVEEGWAKVLPFDQRAIIDLIREDLGQPAASAREGMTPYGDGLASARISDAIEGALTGRSRRLEDIPRTAWRAARTG